MTSDSPAPEKPRPSSRAGRRGRATRRMHPERPCMNCGDPTPGQYCPSCGQRKVDIQVSVRALLAELLEDQFTLDRRLPRTLGALLLRPGHLSVEFVNGRIVRYIHPFRLYLVTSLMFFVLLSFFSVRMVRTAVDTRPEVRVEGPVETSLDSLDREVEQLGEALAEVDEVAADEALPSGVRAAMEANRSVLEQRLEATTARRDALREDTAAAADVRPADAPAVDERERPLRELLGWDDAPPELEHAERRPRLPGHEPATPARQHVAPAGG